MTIVKKLCSNDYFQTNYRGTLGHIPTYLFDLTISKPDTITFSFTAPLSNICIPRLFVLAPNGRVIYSSNNKDSYKFKATATGKYTIKYWLSSKCIHPCTDADKIYHINLDSNEKSIDEESSNIRVWSLIAPGKEGSFYKGENLKEKSSEFSKDKPTSRPASLKSIAR
jgi:hypothetical protein